MASSPIADLTYRNYDGPLEPPINRWWAIAKMSMRLSLKKKGFWVWSSFSCWFYVILLIVFYVNETIVSNVGAAAGRASIFNSLVWRDQFLNAFSESQIFLFILALLMGAGTIANDNRAKALLVYLSKPCSKLDYVIGKWLGIFIPITIIAAIPALMFYGYCLMSYRSYGFWTQDPWLIVQLLGLVLVPGCIYASISLAISSMFQQGRMAGAVLAGVYFISYFFSLFAQGTYIKSVMGGDKAPEMLKLMNYMSVEGLQSGLGKIILHTNGSTQIPVLGAMRGDFQVPAPSALVFIPVFFVLCIGCLLLAWSQIRAVEVVR